MDSERDEAAKLRPLLLVDQLSGWSALKSWLAMGLAQPFHKVGPR